MVSLHNFLALVFQALPKPRLVDLSRAAARHRALAEEVRALRARLEGKEGAARGVEVPQGREVMDDFYLIAQETAVVDSQVGSFLQLSHLHFSPHTLIPHLHRSPLTPDS